MNGQVLAGDYQGASLETLDRATLIKLLNEIDDDSPIYWRLILTAGNPTGVNTRGVMRAPARGPRMAAK
jgi:hypothetical protein